MYGRNAIPSSRADAYNIMAHMAQDMCNEVDYSDKLIERNKELKKEIEKKNRTIEVLESSIDGLKKEIIQFRDNAHEFKEKYLELLKEFKPTDYEKYVEEEVEKFF